MKLREQAIDAMNESFSYIPPHMRQGLTLYIENGIMPGGFMTCVLANDLMGAFGKADIINKEALESICAWIYNYAPTSSHGSYELVKAWSAQYDS